MRLLLICCAVLLGACAGETPAEKLSKLRAMKAGMAADLIRQRGDCQAQAVEMAGMPMQSETVKSCVEAFRVMADAIARSNADIDRRIEEIQRTGR